MSENLASPPVQAKDAPGRPPAELDPKIPLPVSDIVMKLLAKEAEDRYQSALGLRFDLETCLDRARPDGSIEPFPLGARDLPDRLQIPQKLYGREAETQALLDAFERIVTEGTPELVLVSGYSGIGKSSLVQELHKPVIRERGLFMSGKFEQYKGNIPYFTLAQALRQLVLEILSESEARISAVRRELHAALGGGGQLIVDLLAEVALIIGEQPPVPELPPGEAQNRFNLIFQQFLGVFTQREHPVVLFLDDLQWADAASLKLLSHIITHPDTRHLLVIGAYRDNEVSPAHPLILSLAEMQRAGAAVRSVVLSPLSAEHLGRLLADALHRRLDDVAMLARLLSDRTAGNPFFAIEFLLALNEEHLIELDAQTLSFRWDMEKIEAKSSTDNVVELLLTKIRRLPAATQAALTLAACAGNSADLYTLSVSSGRSEEETLKNLWPAVQESLLLIQGDGYRFLHDRVQQAAYLLLPEAEREETHLRIGRLLLAHTPRERVEERLFDIVNQLNLGAALIVEGAEKRALAELNLAAGRKARASAAYAAAASYFSAGMARLEEDSWQSHYELTYSLHLERARAEYVNGDFTSAERLLSVLLARARSNIDKADTYCAKIDVHTTKGEMREAIDTGLECMAMFGIRLPRHPTEEQVQESYQSVQRSLGGRKVEDLIDLPFMADPEMRALMRVLSSLFAPTHFSDQNLSFLVVTSMVNVTLAHGTTDVAAWAYTCFGMALVSPEFRKFQDGYAFGKLAHDLIEKYGFIACKTKTFMVFGNIISIWTRHVATAAPYIDAALRAGVENGDLNFSCYCCNHKITIMLSVGEPLEAVFHESERRLDFVRKAREQNICDIIVSQQRFIQNMRGLTAHFSTFTGAAFDQEEFESRLARSTMAIAVCWYFILKLQARFLSGDHEEALAAADRAKELLWASSRDIQIADYFFFAALAMAAAHDRATPDRQRALLEALDAHQRRLQEWAESCPENFFNRHALVSAEIARLTGRDMDAMRLYEQAIRSARENGFSHNEGIGNELCGRFYLERGLATTALGHLREARSCYARWGADGKVKQLEQRYPELAPQRALAPTATFAASATEIDLLSVVKASQSISGEIVLSRLVEKLIQVVIEEAGAQRGYLIRHRKEALSVEIEADVSADGREIRVLRRGAPLETAALPGAIVNYVKRTREAVILDDARCSARFAGDEYLAGQRPRSVLCLPLVRQAELVGLLYLENNLVAGAFTRERLAVLDLLVSQAAISLENATLYASLEQENAERRRAEEDVRKLNEELELRVLDRTAQFSAANQELEAFSYSVSHDLRAPLRTIDTFTLALLEDHKSTLDAEALDHLVLVRNANQRMKELIDDMLKLARVTRGDMDRQQVDLSALAGEVAAGLERADPARQVEFVIAEGLRGDADARLLRIAIENLLGNAWKFTARHARARIEFGALLQPDSRPAYFVRDDGAGFDMEFAGKLFNPFHRLHPTSAFPGTGIGLATVQRVVRRHGGRVWAEGAVEQGATFYFTLG